MSGGYRKKRKKKERKNSSKCGVGCFLQYQQEKMVQVGK
jgi:hypothetical protein